MSESKTIQVTATPEVLAEMAVRPASREDGALNGVTLHWPSGTYAGMVGRLPVEDPGASNPLAYVRAWLVGHITAAYETGKAEGEKASRDDLGWHAAMGHVAQILGVDDSGDPKAIEERIRAEVSRLKSGAACAVGDDVVWLRARIADLTAEVDQQKADVAKARAEGAKTLDNLRLRFCSALSLSAQVEWPAILGRVRDVCGEKDHLADRFSMIRTERDNLAERRNQVECHRCELAQMVGLDGGAAWEDVLKGVAYEIERLTAEATKARAEGATSSLIMGRRQGWEAAIEAMDKAAEEDRAAMLAAGDALKAAQERDTLAKNRVVGTSYAATTLRRAAQKAGES